MARAGSTRPPTPRPRTSQLPPSLRTSVPKASRALAVLRTSSPSSKPVMCVRPVARAPSMSARCDIDLSPGTRTRPDNARDLIAHSGEGEEWGTGAAAPSGYARRLPGAMSRRHRAGGVEPVNTTLSAPCRPDAAAAVRGKGAVRDLPAPSAEFAACRPAHCGKRRLACRPRRSEQFRERLNATVTDLDHVHELGHGAGAGDPGEDLDPPMDRRMRPVDEHRQDLLIAVREGFYHDCQQRTELINPVGRHHHRCAEACTRNLERGIGLEALADAIEIPTQPCRVHLAQ